MHADDFEESSDGSDIAGLDEMDTSSSDDDIPLAKRARPQTQPDESRELSDESD